MIDYIASIYIRCNFLVGNTTEYAEKYIEDDLKIYTSLIGMFAIYPLSYEIVQMCLKPGEYFRNVNNYFDLLFILCSYLHIGFLWAHGELSWYARCTLVILIMMLTTQVLNLLKAFEIFAHIVIILR